MTDNNGDSVYLAQIGATSTASCGIASGFGTTLVGGNIWYNEGSQVNGIQLFYAGDSPSTVTLGTATGSSQAT